MPVAVVYVLIHSHGRNTVPQHGIYHAVPTEVGSNSVSECSCPHFVKEYAVSVCLDPLSILYEHFVVVDHVVNAVAVFVEVIRTIYSHEHQHTGLILWSPRTKRVFRILTVPDSYKFWIARAVHPPQSTSLVKVMVSLKMVTVTCFGVFEAINRVEVQLGRPSGNDDIA